MVLLLHGCRCKLEPPKRIIKTSSTNVLTVNLEEKLDYFILLLPKLEFIWTSILPNKEFLKFCIEWIIAAPFQGFLLFFFGKTISFKFNKYSTASCNLGWLITEQSYDSAIFQLFTQQFLSQLLILKCTTWAANPSSLFEMKFKWVCSLKRLFANPFNENKTIAWILRMASYTK